MRSTREERILGANFSSGPRFDAAPTSRMRPAQDPLVAGEPASSEHYVQFYKDDSALLASVSEFIAGGMHSGAGCIVIATQPHLDGLERQWRSEGLDLVAARKRGQYVPLVAAETLSKVRTTDGRTRDASPT